MNGGQEETGLICPAGQGAEARGVAGIPICSII
jgi:hypothetical protein